MRTSFNRCWSASAYRAERTVARAHPRSSRFSRSTSASCAASWASCAKYAAASAIRRDVLVRWPQSSSGIQDAARATSSRTRWIVFTRSNLNVLKGPSHEASRDSLISQVTAARSPGRVPFIRSQAPIRSSRLASSETQAVTSFSEVILTQRWSSLVRSSPSRLAIVWISGAVPRRRLRSSSTGTPRVGAVTRGPANSAGVGPCLFNAISDSSTEAPWTPSDP